MSERQRKQPTIKTSPEQTDWLVRSLQTLAAIATAFAQQQPEFVGNLRFSQDHSKALLLAFLAGQEDAIRVLELARAPLIYHELPATYRISALGVLGQR